MQATPLPTHALLSPQGLGDPHALDTTPVSAETMLQAHSRSAHSPREGAPFWHILRGGQPSSLFLSSPVGSHRLTYTRSPRAGAQLQPRDSSHALPSSTSDGSCCYRETCCPSAEQKAKSSSFPSPPDNGQGLLKGSATSKEHSFTRQDRPGPALGAGERAVGHRQWLELTDPSGMSMARGRFAQRTSPKGPT